MEIAELFVRLGVKGASETKTALSQTKNTLGEVSTSALAAKAAIVATIYAVERLMSTSAAAGNGLQQFSDLTGLSAEQLQRYQFAARQAGATNENLMSSIKGVQSAITNMLLGKGQPEALQMLAKTVGGLDLDKIRDPFYMMQKIQEFVQKAPADLSRALLPSFGLTEDVISAMHQGVFNEGTFKKAPVRSSHMIKALQHAHAAFGNFEDLVTRIFDGLTAKHGASLANDFSKLAVSVGKTVDQLVVLAEKVHLFKGIEKTFDGFVAVLRDVSLLVDTINHGIDVLTGNDKGQNVGKRYFGQGTWWMNGVERFEDLLLTGMDPDHNLAARNKMLGMVRPISQNPNKHTEINVNQNIVHHGDAKDTRAVMDTHKAGASRAFYQNSARAGGI